MKVKSRAPVKELSANLLLLSGSDHARVSTLAYGGERELQKRLLCPSALADHVTAGRLCCRSVRVDQDAVMVSG